MFENFSKLGRTVPLRNKNAQTITDSFKNILNFSQRKLVLNKTDRGKEVLNKIFSNLLNDNDIKGYSKNTPMGAVFIERFNKTISDLLKRPVFEKGHCNWVHVLTTITNQYDNHIHSSTKLTPIQASSKKNETYIFQNLAGKRKKIKPRSEI